MFFFVSLLVFHILLSSLRGYFEEVVRVICENRFVDHVFCKIQIRGYSCIAKVHSGEWMNLLTSDTRVVADGLATILPGIIGMFVRMLGAIVVILYLEPKSGTLIVVCSLLMGLCAIVFRRKSKVLHMDMQKKEGETKAFYQEQIESLMVIKTFAQEARVGERGRQYLQAYKSARLKKAMFSTLCHGGLGLATYGALVIGVIYGAFGILHGAITYGTMLAVIQLISQIQNPFAGIAGYLPRYYSMMGSADRLRQLEDLPIDPYWKESYDEVEGFCSLELRNVSFSYEKLAKKGGKPERIPVLKNFSLSLKKEEFVAFVGPSGCGKSTVLKLILGLYQPEEGTISVQNRLLFAYVPQGNMLMTGSIREVVSFANPQKAGEDEVLYRVLELACAKEFVENLKFGLDTPLGEHGGGLSEGQMQRLSIARALFADREVILLDEATSALDEKTEARLLDNLKKIHKTVMIVTHRPAALSRCDRVIVFGGEKM